MHPSDDFVPVIGGDPLPKTLVRDDVAAIADIKADSELDLHILRLVALHPDLRVRFGNLVMAQLDVEAKQTLLDEMNELLGIRAVPSVKQ